MVGMVTVCTVLPPLERSRIDAAGDVCFDTLHAASLREALSGARRPVGRNAAVFRGRGQACAGVEHRTRVGAPPPRATQHVDVTLPSRRDSLAQELSRRYTVAACRVPVSESGTVGIGRGVPHGLLVTAELWPSSARGARRHRGGVSPPLSIRGRAGALHRSAPHPVPGGPAYATP